MVPKQVYPLLLTALLLLSLPAYTQPPPEFAVIDSLVDLGQREQAMLLLDNILESSSSPVLSFEARIRKGKLMRLNRDFAAGKAYITESLELLDRQTLNLDSIKARLLLEKGILYGESGEPQPEIQCYEQALAIQKRLYGEQHLDIATTYNEMSIHYQYEGDLLQQLAFAEKAFNIRKALLPADDQLLGQAYINLAVALSPHRRYDQMLYYYKQALGIYQQHYPPDHNELGLLYLNMATAYSKLGDDELAIDYYRQSLQILRKSLGESHPYTLTLLKNLATLYIDRDDYTQAEHYLQQAIKRIQEASNIPPTFHAYIYERAAQAALLKPDPDLPRGKNYLEQAQAIVSKLELREQSLLASYWSTYYEKLGNFAEAKRQLQQSIELLQQPETAGLTADLAIAYFRMASLYEGSGKYPTALEWVNRSLSTLNEELDLDRIQFSDLTKDQRLLEILVAKIDLLYQVFKATPSNRSPLDEALTTLRQMDDYFRNLRQNFLSNDGEHLRTAYVFDAYRLGVSITFQLYQLTHEERFFREGFYFAETAKSLMLNDGLNLHRLDHTNLLPDSLIERQTQIRSQLAALRRRQSEGKDTTDLTNAIFQQQQALLALQETIQRDYPRYFAARYNFEPTPPEKVAEMLPPQTTLVEYLIRGEELYCFWFTQNDSGWERVPLGNDFTAQCLEFSRLLSTPRSGFGEFKATNAHLSEILLRPIDDLLTEAEHLIIIPDQILGYLPFELFSLTGESATSFADYPYLLKNCTVSYAYSSSLLQEQQQIQHQAEAHFAGFAPNYNGETDSQWTNLPASKEEVLALQNICGGEAFLGSKANKQQFLSATGRYRLLHLAMHAYLDEDQPLYSRLLFGAEAKSDQQLTISELYNLNLKADLVTLSACNTGIGQVRKGEGIMSLSRAFAYAGTPATLMSLWTVPDKKTAELMQAFYREITAGKSKAQAIREAKLAFLQQQDLAQAKHPYYWAGFILSGDSRPISVEKGRPYIWAGVLLLVLLALGIGFARRRNGWQ